jgi:acetolactate synthase-1/2/3 large subunit
MPAETIVIAEPGTPTPNISAFWETPVAGRTVIDPRGHGPMGYVIPAAFGVATAAPDRPVVGLTGDGSFAMACGELETIARYGLPILYLQFTNRSLGWIKMLQHLYLDGRYFSVDPGPIDYSAVAKAMGVDGVRVDSMDRLEAVLADWVTNRRPLYVDVPVPDQIALPPPVAPWQAALAGQAERPVY